MTISVIILLLNDTNDLTPLLAHLTEQPVDFEVIAVDYSYQDRSALIQDHIRLVSVPGVTRAAALNAGAAAAEGDILLFWDPDIRLPTEALPTIEQNLRLLPQSIGGDFHLNFEENSLFTRLFAHFLKWWRYRGHYDGSSGIFIRKAVFEAIGGFRPYLFLADYDLTRRMEKYGPTIYLPEIVVISNRKLRGRKLRTILTWLVIYPLFRLGVHPRRLTRLVSPKPRTPSA